MYYCLLLLLFSQVHIAKAYDIAEQFQIITMLYNEKNEKRCKEYIECIERNLDHDLISGIHIMYDTSSDNTNGMIFSYIREKKLPITYTKGRATYGDCFKVANLHYADRKIIVMNADIYFNHTLLKLRGYDLNNKFFALTRWEINEDGSLRPQYGHSGRPLYNSQDVWIFKSPIRKFKNDKIKLGLMGCDGAIAKQALLSGLEVSNPCWTIQCCHLHKVNVHNYLKEPSYPPSMYHDVKWSHLN